MADSGTATKKSTSTRSTAKKSTAKKSTAKKTTAKKSTATPSRPGALQVAEQAGRELVALTGKSVEGVVGLERTEDGWLVQVEVLELRRIPDTTDVLALYEVQADTDGALQGYRRLRRYARGNARGE